MARAFALNTVNICAKPGERGLDGKTARQAVVETRLPGAVFECSDDDFAAFEAAGAVRKPSKAEEAEAKAIEPTLKV